MKWTNPTSMHFEFWYVENNYTWYLRRHKTEDKEWSLVKYNSGEHDQLVRKYIDLDQAKVELLVMLSTL